MKLGDGWLQKMLELLHKEEKLPLCGEYRCKLERESLRESRDEKDNEATVE